MHAWHFVKHLLPHMRMHVPAVQRATPSPLATSLLRANLAPAPQGRQWPWPVSSAFPKSCGCSPASRARTRTHDQACTWWSSTHWPGPGPSADCPCTGPAGVGAMSWGRGGCGQPRSDAAGRRGVVLRWLTFAAAGCNGLPHSKSSVGQKDMLPPAASTQQQAQPTIQQQHHDGNLPDGMHHTARERPPPGLGTAPAPLPRLRPPPNTHATNGSRLQR